MLLPLFLLLYSPLLEPKRQQERKTIELSVSEMEMIQAGSGRWMATYNDYTSDWLGVISFAMHPFAISALIALHCMLK
jgi:hypothetical protein